MKVGVVTQKFVTGDGQGYINYALAKAALARGHTLVLIGSEIAPDLQAQPGVTWAPVSPSALPTQLLRDQAFAWKSYRLLRRYRPTLDLLMVNGAITWTGADVNAIHFVHDAWGRSPARKTDARSRLHTLYHDLYTRVNSAWERWSLRRAGHVVAVSNMVKDQVDALGLDVPVHVIPNGIDPAAFSPHGPTVPRAEMGVPSDVPLALFVGDIRTSLKNLDTVLYALQDVPALHLAVAGSAEESPFPALATTLGVADRVHFLGFRRDIPALMRTADLFVFPSRYETFSLVLLEAMACGTPVITARTVAAAEFVSPDAGIVLDDPNDREALVAALTALAVNPRRRATMGHAAHTIAQHYDIRDTANRYVDLFERLAEAVPEARSLPTDSAPTSSSQAATRLAG